MSWTEYAAGDDPLHGANPLRARGLFPLHWGEVPDNPEALRCWIAGNAVNDGARKGHPGSILTLLELRRKDPSARREEAWIATASRMRREELAALLQRCP